MTMQFTTREANHLISPELQFQLFHLIDSQIKLGLVMDHWQFFQLHRINANRIQVIHSQCHPERREEHIFVGFNLPVNELEVWIINYGDLGSALMIADDYNQIPAEELHHQFYMPL
ncbi:hypothetical protein G9G63_14675 [Paenibacillus sp. EKM202P]|uniref:DUF960 family protein n=1 Tax=unclassified Paenibacillus TaxID=185978 RepID=UPI0013ED2235|nr:MULTISPECIES: DUF960 family protein [unclassified Paenibacillus]KAF6563431.1 hypothetical protein G9G63_14675 [Paenibacillus sp. EKM202P]KAF6569973.1 hypothetical protein G9G64_10200 [Paenibacillus sp. EKM207P]